MKPKKSQRRGYYAVAAASRTTTTTTTTSAALLLASASPLSTTISLDEYQHYCVNDGGGEEGVVDGGDVDVDDEMSAAVAAVESLLGYAFRDVRLLEEALTHPSHPTPGVSYQRLEFLGDAAVGLALTNHIFLTNPNAGPGRLTLLRSANISTEKLARVAVRHGLYHHIRRSAPHLDALVRDFEAAVAAEEAHDAELAAIYGGAAVKAPKVLADVVESVAGAVYVDCGFDLESLWRVFRGLLEPIITDEVFHEQPVTALHVLCQKQGQTVVFKNWRKGDRNVTNAFVDGKLLGIGCSDQKDIAKLNAARDALRKLCVAPDEVGDDPIA